MVQKQLCTRETGNRFKNAALIVYYVLESFVKLFIPMSMMKRKNVENQTVLITGAGSGIGQLLALKFLRLGAKVIVWDVSQDGMETTKKMAEEEKLNAKNVHLYRVDLRDSKSIYETAEQVKQQIGPVDILINNAGVVSGQNFLDIPDDRIEMTFKVNSLAHFYTIKAFLPDMIKRKNGHIVTVASIAGRFGVCGLSDYCASKFANVGMDYSLRMELAKANLDECIKTTLVQPYFITTGMFAGVHPGVFEFMKPDTVVDRTMQAILTDSQQVVIPTFFDYLLCLQAIIPQKCILPVYDFIGGFEFMTNFHGRQPLPPSSTTTKQTKIN
ncbi:epidermal retinol dehydrogenase 2-like protein, partial [Euroglyphus maynei]